MGVVSGFPAKMCSANTIGRPWVTHDTRGLPMGCPWAAHGSPIDRPYVFYVWVVHEPPMRQLGSP